MSPESIIPHPWSSLQSRTVPSLDTSSVCAACSALSVFLAGAGSLGNGRRVKGREAIACDAEVGAGVAYVRLETSPDPVRVRAAYVTDADIEAMAALVTAGGEAP